MQDWEREDLILNLTGALLGLQSGHPGPDGRQLQRRRPRLWPPRRQGVGDRRPRRRRIAAGSSLGGFPASLPVRREVLFSCPAGPAPAGSGPPQCFKRSRQISARDIVLRLTKPQRKS